MQAAADAFAEKGFHATTTRDIASGAGLSPAGVYVHFGSKEELLFNLSRSGHGRARDLLVAAAQASPPRPSAARDRRRASPGGTGSSTSSAASCSTSTTTSAPSTTTRCSTLRKEIDQVVAGVLREGVASGEFEVADVSATALALLSMAIDVARWYTPDVRRTPEAIETTYGDLAVRLVRAA